MLLTKEVTVRAGDFDLTKYEVHSVDLCAFIEESYDDLGDRYSGENFGGVELREYHNSTCPYYIHTDLKHLPRPIDDVLRLDKIIVTSREGRESHRCFPLGPEGLKEFIDDYCSFVEKEPKPEVGDLYCLRGSDRIREVSEVRDTAVICTTGNILKITDFALWSKISVEQLALLDSNQYDVRSQEIFNKYKQPTEIKEKPMNKLKATATLAASANKEAGLNAAKLKVGKTAINLAIKMVKPKMPVGTKGFIDHPIAGIVLANAAKMAVEQMAGDNLKAKAITKAMLTYSYFELIDKIDLEGMLEEITAKFKGASVDKLMKEQEDIIID